MNTLAVRQTKASSIRPRLTAALLALTLGIAALNAQNIYINPLFKPKAGNTAPPISSQPALAAFSPSSGGWSDYNTYPRLMADVNGDGKADIVGFGSTAVAVSLSTGSGFAPPANWISNFSVQNGAWLTDDSYPRMLGDVNGDGKADIIGFGDEGVYVALSTGTAFGAPTIWTKGYTAQNWPSAKQYPRRVADVNGDGKADIIAFAHDGVYVSLSNGSSFAAPVKWNPSFTETSGWMTSDSHPRWVADVNGDGKADVVGFGAGGIVVALSTGTSFATAQQWSLTMGAQPAAGAWAGPIHIRVVADVNGDGKADAIGIKSDGIWVALSTGTAFAAPTQWSPSFGSDSGPWPDGNLAPRWVADFNGDKKADIVGFTADGVYTAINSGKDFRDQSLVPQGVNSTGNASGGNFCWKATYTRGAGTLKQDCPAGTDSIGGVCYSQCPSGMTGVGLTCWSNCPAGYTDIGVSCAKPGATTSAGYPWQFGDTAFDFVTGPKARCEAANGAGNCYQSGLIWYPKCPAGYAKVGDLVCSPSCPTGLRDDGAFCAKAAQQRTGTTASCPTGLATDPLPTSYAGLFSLVGNSIISNVCYPACSPDFDGVGPVCWGKCQGALPYSCGAGCSKDSIACAQAVSDMAVQTTAAAISLITLALGAPGVGDAVTEALTAGKQAVKTAMWSGMKMGSTELIQPSTKILVKSAAKQFAKSMWANTIDNRNLYSKALKLGGSAYLKALNEAANQMGDTADATPGFDWTNLTALDPTGISAAVAAFAKYPSCTVDAFKPTVDTVDFGTIVDAKPVSKTFQLQVQQTTTFTQITTPAHTGACSVVPVSDCLGKTLKIGDTCNVTVTATAPGANLLSEIRIYTTDYDAMPYGIPVTANSNLQAQCTTDPSTDEAVNLTSLVGGWTTAANAMPNVQGSAAFPMAVAATGVATFNSSTAGTWTVHDSVKRTFDYLGQTYQLSQFGEILTPLDTTRPAFYKLHWDSSCPVGTTRSGAYCYLVPPGYELTFPGRAGKQCPNGWRDDLTGCWPRWTGMPVWGQADVNGGPEMQFPLMVTSASLASIGCPPNFTLGALTCVANRIDRAIVKLENIAPVQ